VLGALVEKSLVVADDDGDRVRYRLLESSRAYALEKLTESGTRATLADRHAHWVSAFVERAYERGWTEPVRRWLGDVEPEADNVRSALDWALGAGEFVLAGHTISLLSTYWFECASAEGQRWVDAALAHLDAAAHCVQVGRLLLVSAVLGHSDRSVEAAERATGRPEEAATTLDRVFQLYEDARARCSSALRGHKARFATAAKACFWSVPRWCAITPLAELALIGSFTSKCCRDSKLTRRSPNSRSARANIFRSLRLR
jgi:hypothetical protein